MRQVKSIVVTIMKYIRNNKLYTKRIKNKWYILEPNKKVMRELNEVGSTIWGALIKPCIIEDLVKQVCEKYSVEVAIAEKDIKKFVSEYVKDGYIINGSTSM